MSTPYEKDIPAHAEDIDTEKGSVANMKPRTGDMALALVGNERIDLTQEDVSALSCGVWGGDQ